MKDEVILDNKLIVEFMGYEYIPFDPNLSIGALNTPCGYWKIGDYIKFLKSPNYLCRRHKDLRYHQSWDWLMPCVEKINSLHKLDLWNKNNVDRYALMEALDGVDINDTYYLIIMFIKWYNKTK